MPSYRPRKCPRCGKWLIERYGKFGKFLGCTGYPKCKYTFDLPWERSKNKISCPICGVIVFKRKIKDIQYLVCKRYPKCKFKQRLREEDKLKIRCPTCNKKMCLTWEPSGWLLKCISKKCGYIYNIDMGFGKNSYLYPKESIELRKNQHEELNLSETNILRAVSFDWRDLEYIIKKLEIYDKLDITYLKNKLKELERKKHIVKIIIENLEYWKKG